MKQKLIIKVFAILATEKGFGGAMRVLCNKEVYQKVMQRAKDEVEKYIAAVKQAKDNHYKTDDEICEVILKQLDERLSSSSGSSQPTTFPSCGTSKCRRKK